MAGRRWRRLASVIVVVIIAATGCSKAVAGQPAPQPAPSAGPLLTNTQLAPLLLPDDAIAKTVGAQALKTYSDYSKIDDDRGIKYTQGDRICAAAKWNTVEENYRGTNYTGVLGRKISEPGDTPAHDVDEAVVLYKTADAAQRQLDRSMVIWQHCADRRLGFQYEGKDPEIWTVGIPADVGPNIVVRNSLEAGDGWACQHAMQTKGNVVIDVYACGTDVTDQAATIANDITAKVH